MANPPKQDAKGNYIGTNPPSPIKATPVGSPIATKPVQAKPVIAKAAGDPTKQTNVRKAGVGAFKITPLAKQKQWINMIVYGGFGSGKTTLAGSAADVEKMSDVLYVDIESGSMSILDSDRIKKPENIDSVRITTYKQLGKIFDFVNAHCKHRDDPSEEATEKLKQLQAVAFQCDVADIETPRRYNTIVIDSLSELDQLCQYELLGLRTDRNIEDDIEVADWNIFRKNNAMIQLVIRAYRDLPINVIFVCSASYTQDDLKRMHFAPTMTGKLSGQIQGFVDIVGYLVVGKQEDKSKSAPRVMYVQPVGKFDAKNRSASFKESYIKDPTMLTVCKAIRYIK